MPAVLLIAAVFLIVSCKSKESPAAGLSAGPMQSDIRQCVKRQCLGEGECANFTISYLKFSGGDSAGTAAITESFRSFILSMVGGDSNIPFEAALDSAGTRFCAQYLQAKKDDPEMAFGYLFDLSSALLVNNPKIVTLEMSGSSFSGEAHPNSFATLVTYDMQNKGQVLPVTALVSDTTAILPMLEKAYKLSKGMTESGDISELLYPELTHLPLPANVAVVPEGIRFYYNDYEVASHAVGPADLVLSWAELGSLADQKKWF